MTPSMQLRVRTLLAILSVSIPTIGEAASQPSRIGTEIKAMSIGGGLALTYGWRYTSFESDRFFLGGAAYTGQLGSDGGSLALGGFVAGQKGRLGSSMETSLQLLAGAITTRNATGTADGGLMLEPSLNLGIIMGPTVRSIFNAGYAWTPGGTDASGVTFGLRFEFLLDSPPSPPAAPVPAQASAAPSQQPNTPAPAPRTAGNAPQGAR